MSTFEYEVELTPEHKKNLLILRNFMANLPPEMEDNFDMGDFCSITLNNGGISSESPNDAINRLPGGYEEIDCGTSMCLIGWTVAIPEFKEIIDGAYDSWDDISDKLFGCDADFAIGEYLFSHVWSDRSKTNTIEHALQRIDNVLKAETQEEYNSLIDLIPDQFDEDDWWAADTDPDGVPYGHKD